MVVAATTLEDTLVELHLSKWAVFVKSKFNTSESIVQFSVHLGFHTCLIVRCIFCEDLGRSTHILRQANIVVSIGDEGYIGAQSI